jgi:hypothetical protein
MQVQESDKPSWKSSNIALIVIALLLVGAGACIICDIINKTKTNFDWYDLGGLVFIVLAIVLVGVVLVQSAVVRERVYAICPSMRPKKGNMVAVPNNDTSNKPKPVWTPTALAETGIVVLLLGVATIQIADMVKDANNDKNLDGFSLGATVCTCLALLCTFWLISQTVVIRNKCRTLCPLVEPYKEINGVTYQNQNLQTQQYYQNMQQPNQNMQNMQQPNPNMHNMQQPNPNMHNMQQPNQNMQNMQQPSQQPGQVMQQPSQQPGQVMQNMQQPNQNMQNMQQPNQNMQNMQQPNQNMQNMQQPSQQPSQQPGQVMQNMQQPSQQPSQQVGQQQIDGLNQGLHDNSDTHGLQGGRRRKYG